MSITDPITNTNILGLGAAGAKRLEAIVRRWPPASWAISKTVANIRDPRLRVEVRLTVHEDDQPSTEPAQRPRSDSGSAGDAKDEELAWELLRLLAGSGGMLADAARALERRSDDLDRMGRALLQDEVSAVELDVAVLKTLLSDPVDWDTECKRLLAGEVPPFEGRTVDDEQDEAD